MRDYGCASQHLEQTSRHPRVIGARLATFSSSALFRHIFVLELRKHGHFERKGFCVNNGNSRLARERKSVETHLFALSFIVVAKPYLITGDWSSAPLPHCDNLTLIKLAGGLLPVFGANLLPHPLIAKVLDCTNQMNSPATLIWHFGDSDVNKRNDSVKNPPLREP